MTETELMFKDYVERRFNRLADDINDKLKTQSDEVKSLITSNDLRYQQRFEAQGKALDAAFGAAKEAVNAALAGADKAAVKTEQTVDKRFADLGDLIKEQFKGILDKFDASLRRIEIIEGRLNLAFGETTGGQKIKEDQRGLWAIIISAGAALLVFWKVIIGK